MSTTADEMKELYEKYLTKEYAQSVVASEKHDDIDELLKNQNFVVEKIE